MQTMIDIHFFVIYIKIYLRKLKKEGYYYY